MSELEKLLEILGNQKRWHHYECEDGFYSCPAHPDYLGNNSSGKCNCGMIEDNANIDAAIKIVDELIKKERRAKKKTKKPIK